MLIPAFDVLDFFFTKWTVKWYLGHRKTVCKYSQMICLYWSLLNWQIYCLSEQNGSHFVDSKQTNYPQCIVVQLMSITNMIKFIHLVGSKLKLVSWTPFFSIRSTDPFSGLSWSWAWTKFCEHEAWALSIDNSEHEAWALNIDNIAVQICFIFLRLMFVGY